MNIINLIRWKNLLMIAIVQLLIKYALLEPFGVPTSLNTLGIVLLILATICIAAAGNIINDIYDIETDFINKPDKIIVGKSISEKTAYNLFIIFNVVGVSIGFYLSHMVDRNAFFSLFVIISALLYVYATYLKQTLLIGNIVISVLVALSLIIVGIFELLPATISFNQQTQLTFFKIIFDYAVFAFIINLLREITKDLEDINGDYKAGMNTLPIAIGTKRATKVLFTLSFVPLFIVGSYVVNSLYKNQIAVLYFLIFIIAPLIYITIKLFNASTKKDFHHISNMLKLVMLFGMLSLLLYKYILL
ncbi:geranylgeranylglycerol-phosphate geranylgeranyltransferase [Mariniflexile litorale]|uniref:Geranylgeranylglycerol-phosphate geranylgeranyltransferase n=1 Tax=Mariniflexile litorale TaxID=3045158 RepID=A0AAU7EGM9_9FLAO|nr:geranylgeranylglycerol-phosphate geranylgeranyltransferase [Mariniflexile sp. KMM 9835]MDQ8211789.1 geranylgeranylglycerol-phosphate geranylgeranyltransferase [Mariniflexile sp. KMM 9835]